MITCTCGHKFEPEKIYSHRVMCGNSTKVEDVERLMDEEKAVLFATDPPYGCNAGNIGFTAQRDKIEAITKDDLEGKEMQSFLESVFKIWVPYLDDNCAWYLWHPMLTQGYFAAAAAAAAADLIIHRQIIWKKEQFIFGRGDYHWRHELCFYGWRQGNRPQFYGKRNQDTIWDIPWGQKRSELGHPTAKPIDLFLIPMQNHVTTNEVCAEPFAGSGSQLIAGCKAKVRTFNMEISPKYCDVICKRFFEFTGKRPVRESDGKEFSV
jgi:DNA modification methylase